MRLVGGRVSVVEGVPSVALSLAAAAGALATPAVAFRSRKNCCRPPLLR
jgi:hypothetical protein